MPEPRYLSFQAQLKDELRSGRFHAGDKFYTDQELMEKYGLSSITVTRAVNDMAQQGYFVRKRKLGTFVLESPETPGMSGNVMVKPLYLNGLEEEEMSGHPGISWFVVEEIRRGIINNYPGAVRIEKIDDIEARLLAGEDILCVLYRPEPEVIPRIHQYLHKVSVIDLRCNLKLANNSVAFDTLTGVYEAMAHLIRCCNHKRIGYVGPVDQIYSADRYAGYRIGLEAMGIPFCQDLVFRREGLLTYEDGYAAMQQLLALPQPPTAVFVDTDKKALGALAAVHDADLRVPDDISIIGFDDIAEAASCNPPLTTIRVPYYDIGKAAVELLFKQIRSGHDVPSEVIRTELVIRSSVTRRG